MNVLDDLDLRMSVCNHRRPALRRAAADAGNRPGVAVGTEYHAAR